jgi:hypothetical protein
VCRRSNFCANLSSHNVGQRKKDEIIVSLDQVVAKHAQCLAREFRLLDVKAPTHFSFAAALLVNVDRLQL